LRCAKRAADTAYGTGKFLSWLMGTGITPHIPVWDMSQRDDGTLGRSDFIFDAARNVYICPQGKLLKTTGRVHDGRTLLYRASKCDCDVCSLKPKCSSNSPERKIPRDVNEQAREFARSLAGTEPFGQSRRERKKVEMRESFGFETQSLRGPLDHQLRRSDFVICSRRGGFDVDDDRVLHVNQIIKAVAKLHALVGILLDYKTVLERVFSPAAYAKRRRANASDQSRHDNLSPHVRL
jgi:hypothetical protein